MQSQRRSSRLNAWRWLALAAALAWGLVEFLALQRSRYSQRHLRS